MITRLGRRLRRDDDGLTLIELLVAIILLGVLLTIVASVYISSLSVVALGRDLTQNTKVAANAMNEASRVIRAGTDNPRVPPTIPDPAFVIAKRDEVLMYAFINLTSAAEQPQMIRIRVDRTTGKVIESRWPAVQSADKRWQFPANPCVTVNNPVGCAAPTQNSVLAQTISPQGTGATALPDVFSYLDADGNAITQTSAGLSLADRRKVSAVRVSISVQTSLTDKSNAVLLENTVGIPNLGFAQESS